MQAVSVESSQNDLIRSILSIHDIAVLKRLQVSVRHAKEKLDDADNASMSKEDFLAMLDRRMDEYEKGNYIAFSSPEEMHRYFENV